MATVARRAKPSQEKKPTAAEMAEAASIGVAAASAVLNPEVRRIVANLEHDPRDTPDITKTLSAEDILDLASAVRKADHMTTTRMTTAEMIQQVARCMSQGRPYWPVAARLRPDLPLEEAKHYLRSRVSKNRKKIDALVRQMKRKQR